MRAKALPCGDEPPLRLLLPRLQQHYATAEVAADDGVGVGGDDAEAAAAASEAGVEERRIGASGGDTAKTVNSPRG